MKKGIVLLFAAAAIFCVILFSAVYLRVAPDNSVVIYISSEEYRVRFYDEELNAKFPDYDIQLERMPSGEQALRLMAEGFDTPCDISFELDYSFADLVEPYLADLSSFDFTKFADDAVLPGKKLLPELRNGGCIAINVNALVSRGLPVPVSYADLLNPVYRRLISMPNPRTSGTAYAFLKSLVNAWGEDEAFNYFDALHGNLLHLTTSGSGPVNDMIDGSALIGLAITSQAVTELNNGFDLEIVFFEEGSPYTFYGAGIIEGRQNREAVMNVFTYLNELLIPIDKALFAPEKIYRDRDFVVANFPTNIIYSDMSGNTSHERARLLDEKWRF